MDRETAELAAAIGARLRAERRSLGWTLDRLAAAAGVSRRMVVNVEQGTVNPSVGTLLRIGDAVGIGLPELVERPTRTPWRVTRSGEGSALWTGEFGGRGVLVAGTGRPDVVELWEWTLFPGDRHSSEAHGPGTRELLQVQVGAVTVEVDGHSELLNAGDAITFRGDAAHAYAHASGDPARFSLAVHEPDAGTKESAMQDV